MNDDFLQSISQPGGSCSFQSPLFSQLACARMSSCARSSPRRGTSNGTACGTTQVVRICGFDSCHHYVIHKKYCFLKYVFCIERERERLYRSASSELPFAFWNQGQSETWAVFCRSIVKNVCSFKKLWISTEKNNGFMISSVMLCQWWQKSPRPTQSLLHKLDLVVHLRVRTPSQCLVAQDVINIRMSEDHRLRRSHRWAVDRTPTVQSLWTVTTGDYLWLAAWSSSQWITQLRPEASAIP